MLTSDDRLQSKSLDRLFEIIVAHAHETIVVTDGGIDADDGPTIQFANEAAAKRAGYPREALIGTPLRRIVLPEAWPGLLARFRKIRESKQVDQTELRSKDNSGQEFWLDVSTQPIFDAEGVLEYLVRIGRDVTARKTAEQQREMTQDLMASLFGAIDVPLVVAGESGNVMMTNTALQSALGWSMADLRGKPLTDLIETEARPLLPAILKNASAEAQSMSVGLLQKSGAATPGRLHIVKVKSARQTYFVARVEFGAAARNTIRHQTDRPVIAGKLQLVGFAALKNELGARWEELSARIFDIADQVIRKHLAPRDICQRSGSDGFLVFFEDLDEADAQAKAALIGEEVRRRLLGELPIGSALQIAAYAAQVSVDGGDNMTEQDLLDAFNQRLEQERQRLEAIAVQAARQLLETAKPVFLNVETIDRQPAPVVLARLPRDLKAALDRLISLGQVAYSIEADAFTLAGTGAEVIANLARGAQPLVLVPIRFGNLDRRRDVEALLTTLRSVGDAGRGQIAIEVTEVPREMIASRLADIAMRFAPLVRSVVFELPAADPAFAARLPYSTRLATIPADLLQDAHGTVTPAAAKLAEALSLRQCRLIAKDVGPATDLAALKEAGVRMIAAPMA
jgi:PAS domain S-box-containing protein